MSVNNERKVPELSLLSYVNGEKNDRLTFINSLFEGLKDYGFIVLKDHTVDQQKINKAYELTHEFFNLSSETKKKYSGIKGGQRGFTDFGQEHAKDNPNHDLKEFWHVGRELSVDSFYAGKYPSNVWPVEISEFKKVFSELYTAMDATAVILLEAIGKSLDLPEHFFSDMVKDGNSIHRLIHYPPVKGHDTETCIRAAAHGDINLITMLVGATDSGLELLDRDGSWLPVDSKGGEIVVDTGDMMERLTNGILPATIHRVVNPPNVNSTRYSMPFFVHPHSEASLNCLKSCRGEGEKYSPITAGEFLQQRLKEIGLA